MSIKGTATIELTNADGSKKTYKHDNMITNAINDLCTSQRGEMATILKIVNNGDSYAQTLFGGLLLFDETLSADANDYFLPTVKCTGYASQAAYAGLDSYRGSFNQSEGGVQEDGSYKFVWDFATSQANGTIKSLALVPNTMGEIGLPVDVISSEKKSFTMKRTNVDPFRGAMLGSNDTIDDEGAASFFIVAIIDDIAYACSKNNVSYVGSGVPKSKWIMDNGGKLRLYRFKLGASNIALTDKVGKASYIDYTDIQMPTEFTSTLSNEVYKDTIACDYDAKTKTLFVSPCYKPDLAVNGTLKYCAIDMANNYAITTHTFTNNTGSSIYMSNGMYGTSWDRRSLLIVGKYIVTLSRDSSSSYTICVTDMTNNTNVKKLSKPDGTAMVFSSYALAPVFFNNNMLVFTTSQSTDTGTEGKAQNAYVANLATGECRSTNVSFLDMKKYVDGDNKSVFVSTSKLLEYSGIFNPFILCTKNNLDSPVVKTASQTMKITYTLSVADATESEGV